MPAPTPPDAPIPVPTPPDRTDKATFVSRSFIFTNWYIPFQAWLVTVVTYITDSITWVAGLATAAESNATASEASRQAAEAVANYKGEWSSLSGQLNKPATVGNDGAFWALNNNLANVALSEPAPGNPDWTFVSGTRWRTPYNASATLSANSQNIIEATSGAADMSLPSLATNDFVILHNSKGSTQTVRLMNSAYTIRGRRGQVTSGNNLVMRPGDTIHLVAKSTTILEAV